MSITTEIKRHHDDSFLGATAASVADALLKLGSVNSVNNSSNASSSSPSSGRKRNSSSLSSSSSSSSSHVTTHDEDDTSISTIDTIIIPTNKRPRNNSKTYHQTTATTTSAGTILRPIPKPSLGYYSVGGVGGPPSSSSHYNPKKVAVSDDEDEGRSCFEPTRRPTTNTTTTKFSTNKFQINFRNFSEDRNHNHTATNSSSSNNKMMMVMIPGDIGSVHTQSSGFPNPLGAPPLLPMGIVVEEELNGLFHHPTPFPTFSSPSSILSPPHQQQVGGVGAHPSHPATATATATSPMSSAVITEHNGCFVMHSYTILPRYSNNNASRISLHNLRY